MGGEPLNGATGGENCSYARKQMQLREGANAAILQTLEFTLAEPRVCNCEP